MEGNLLSIMPVVADSIGVSSLLLGHPVSTVVSELATVDHVLCMSVFESVSLEKLSPMPRGS